MWRVTYDSFEDLNDNNQVSNASLKLYGPWQSEGDCFSFADFIGHLEKWTNSICCYQLPYFP